MSEVHDNAPPVSAEQVVGDSIDAHEAGRMIANLPKDNSPAPYHLEGDVPAEAEVGDAPPSRAKVKEAQAPKAPKAEDRHPLDDAPETEETDTEEAPELDTGEQEETETAGIDPPEFWNAADKAAWAELTPRAQEVIIRKEAERVAAVREKIQEAAADRTKHEAELAKYKGTVEQGATWWEANGPKFVQAFSDKWAPYTAEVMGRLAAENPGEWARVTEARNQEHRLLVEANDRGQKDIQERNSQFEAKFQETRRAEHEKVAKSLPDYFGTPERAARTYDELGKFLFSKGIPADRIKMIHEAPIIEIALDAMRWQRAQAKTAPAATPQRDADGRFKATDAPTPKHVQPGPVVKTANRQVEQVRQARARLENDPSDTQAAADLIRLAGL